jgi:hypothetical protein
VLLKATSRSSVSQREADACQIERRAQDVEATGFQAALHPQALSLPSQVYGQSQTSGNRPVTLRADWVQRVSQNGQIFRRFAEQRGAAPR